MKDLADVRYMERLCRQRAVFDPPHSSKWLGEAERWKDSAHPRDLAHPKDLTHPKVGDRFREKPSHPGPMSMGPNTIEGDSHRQKHESMQRLQSVTRGG
jgi:hypothetical protein